MPFSRYQIRNEFSLADPELYKAADKDDPEALLEGVAMAGLVGVLRQLGDLAEFAAEIFHDLHEEVMVTATRGHGLLVRVQQLESDFPSIERAFLSQTGHSAFFSSSGVGWHPNLRTEQNLITKGDLPRFVMDSYEECRAPPRLFLLDKFDIAGAGACLKRYTDPSFYKVEASSYEMMSAEAQRDKKTRKTKKKGSQWKNGNTPEPFQPSHVKLHQLLLEERIQNGTCEPTRRVKLKKRKSKFPFDMENGKGYMEKVLSSPPEDKLVHEVPLSSGGTGLETFEITMVDHPPLSLTTQDRSPYESPSVDKMVSREHMDNVMENVPETPVSEMPTSSIRFQPGGARSGSEDEEVEEKHISVNGFQAAGGAHNASDDVASEGDDYEDALATMESEIETDTELRAESDPANESIKQETSDNANVEQIQSQSSGSQSASDDESSSIRKKITSYSYSDDTTTTSVDSSQAFACIEIPFRPRVSATDSAVPVDQEANSKEITSKDSDSSEMPLNNCVDVNNPEKTEELPVDSEAIITSTSEQDKDERNSDSTLVISHAEEQALGRFSEELDICDADMNPNAAEEMEFNPDSCSSPKQKLTDDSLEPGVSYSGEDEMEFEDRKTESVESESKVATSAVCDPADEKDDNLSNLEEKTESTESKVATSAVCDPADEKDDNLSNLEEKTELKDREPESESVTSETKDVDSKENPELGGKEIELINSEIEDLTFADEKNEDGLSTAELGVIQNSNETVEKKESSEKSVISSELDSVPSYDHSNIQFLNGIQNSSLVTELNENNVDNPSAKTESSEKSVISPELDSVSSASCGHEIIDENETLFLTETTDQNEPQTDFSPDSDLQLGDHEVIDQSNAQFLESASDSPLESESLNQVDHVEKLENGSSSLTDSVLVEEKVDQLENASSSLTDSVLVEEKVDQLENASSSFTSSVLVEEKVDQPDMPSFLLETVDSWENVAHEMPFDAHSEPYPMTRESHCFEKDQEFQDPAISESLEPSVLNLSQSSIHIDLLDQIEYPSAPVFSTLPQLSPPMNLDEMPPLPPLPPMQWRMGKPLISKPDGSQHEVNSFPSTFPQIESHPSLDPNEKAGNEKAEYEVLPTESSSHTELEDGNSVISSEVKFPEQIVPQPPLNGDRSQSVSTSGREIFWPSSGSSLPPGDDERPNGIRPMKVQRSRTPLIDAVAAHDKSKLRKVSERARPLIPKEEERDTLLEQIRAKSFNLKPAVQTRPSIQGPTTNLRVAAILERANAIRQAFAGSDDDDDGDDDDGDDGWSDS